MRCGFWRQDYRLDKMNLKDLWIAYFTHYTILAYLILAVISLVMTAHWAESFWPAAGAASAAVIIYPFAWYGLHRYVLHGRWLYRSRLTAQAWKRIHFDHHRDPHDLRVLFGALYTTLPTIALVTMPAGFAIGGVAGLWAAFAAGLLITCFYEFAHCVQHLHYQPRLKILQKMKRLHLQHHFHDEKANYGITSFIPDRVFGTYRPSPKGVAQSETVFNLGYTMDEVRRYPWVARATSDIDEMYAITQGIGRRMVPKNNDEAGPGENAKKKDAA